MIVNVTSELQHDLVAKAKSEILADIEAGRVPASVRSFSELHNYVDANFYGGIEFEGIEDADTFNAMSDAVNEWLSRGRP